MKQPLETNEKVEAAVKVILAELNNISSSGRRAVAATILRTVQHDHRTIQQGFWNAMLFAQMGYADSAHDLRNEKAVELAKLVKEIATVNNLDVGLPFI